MSINDRSSLNFVFLSIKKKDEEKERFLNLYLPFLRISYTIATVEKKRSSGSKIMCYLLVKLVKYKKFIKFFQSGNIYI